MQIHELNNYNGNLDSSAYLAVDNGSDTGKVSTTELLEETNAAVSQLNTSLNGRIDNIIAGGEAPSASEIVDARYGADGVTYPSLGAAIRDQVTDLKSDVSNHLNGFVYNEINFTVVPGAYVNNETGAFVVYEGWDRTDYIEVDATTDLYIESAGKMNFCAVYDENKTFVSNLIINAGFNYLYIRGDVKYIALSTTTGNLAKVKIWNTDMRKVNGSVNNGTDFSNNLINVPWRIGTLDSNGAYNHSWYRLVSDYIELPYKGAEHVIEFNSTWVISIAEYDENKEFIYISSYFSDDTIRVFSPNTKFIRMVAYGGVDETYVKVGDIWSSGISVRVTGLPHKLKVMSYNLGHYAYGTGMGLPANIYDEKLIAYRKFIGEELPDICGFQEYDSKMDEENTILATDVLWGHYYPHKYITGSETALFAKKWISWGGTKQLSTGRYYNEGTMNGIYLISVHPSVGADKASTRIQECTEVINIVKQYERYIIFGDFNCEPNEEDSLFKLFTDEGMNIANCGWFGKFYTWSSNRADFDDYENPTGTLWYIDNIITSPNINIMNAYPVPEAYSLLSSDHIPIIAELEIN